MAAGGAGMADVGVIDGKKINYSEYYDQYEQIKQQNNVQENDEQQSAMLANAVWQTLIAKYVTARRTPVATTATA